MIDKQAKLIIGTTLGAIALVCALSLSWAILAFRPANVDRLDPARVAYLDVDGVGDGQGHQKIVDRRTIEGVVAYFNSRANWFWQLDGDTWEMFNMDFIGFDGKPMRYAYAVGSATQIVIVYAEPINKFYIRYTSQADVRGLCEILGGNIYRYCVKIQ